MRLPANPCCPCLQHSDPCRKDLCLSSCPVSPVPRWHGLEGSTLARHFALDHTLTAQRKKPWQVFWSVECTSSFLPGDTSRSGPHEEQRQSEGKGGFTPLSGVSCATMRGKHPIPAGPRSYSVKHVPQSTLLGDTCMTPAYLGAKYHISGALHIHFFERRYTLLSFHGPESRGSFGFKVLCHSIRSLFGNIAA